MKSILIIGMGRFGRHLCMNLSKQGNQIMIIDEKEENLLCLGSLYLVGEIKELAATMF
mgnify:CR=1 FL=1